MRWAGRFAGYDATKFRKDLLSGFIVGIIAIPLGMAFAIASGVKPEYGIYTTIIAGVLISMLGGSKFQIGGPTGAFIPILFAMVMQYGYENLLIAGFLAGLILVLMGIFKLGNLIKFIPRPVTIGFTSGIAVIIFSGQIANFLGLSNVEQHEYFLSNMKELALHVSSTSLYSLLTAMICLVILIWLPRFMPKIPASLIGLFVSTVIAMLFFGDQVATIGSTFGAIPNTLPEFQFPEITWDKIQMLIVPAFVIAMLGGIESLLSAVVADGMTGDRHNSNKELFGQGVANMVTPLFGGIPATGAIARTATNIKNGAVSPMSGMIHGVVVLLVLLVFAPYASHIPLASMAPILMVVAWNMSERKEFAHILRTKSSDSLVLLMTFLLTVFTNLTVAVPVGLGLSLLLFVKRISDLTQITKVLPDPNVKHEKMKDYRVTEARDCPQINIYTIEGPMFFGVANKFEKSIMDTVQMRSKILLLRMGKVPFMDLTGEANLANLIDHFEKQGGMVLISGIQPQPLKVLKLTGLYQRLGEDRFYEHTGEAVDYALYQLDVNQCLGCKQFAFRECTTLSQGKPLTEASREVAYDQMSLPVSK